MTTTHNETYLDRIAEQNQAKHAAFVDQIEQGWVGKQGARLGDFVRMPGGELVRICTKHPYTFQVYKDGSFHVDGGGDASHSGSCGDSFVYEFLQATNDIQQGRFWTFFMNEVKAHNGVDVMLPCRIYNLVPFKMTHQQATQHPRAIRALRVWGSASSSDYLACLDNLMNPPIMSKLA